MTEIYGYIYVDILKTNTGVQFFCSLFTIEILRSAAFWINLFKNPDSPSLFSSLEKG
jgi:hypothetical protein